MLGPTRFQYSNVTMAAGTIYPIFRSYDCAHECVDPHHFLFMCASSTGHYNRWTSEIGEENRITICEHFHITSICSLNITSVFTSI